MKKIIIALMLTLVGGVAMAQTAEGDAKKEQEQAQTQNEQTSSKKYDDFLKRKGQYSQVAEYKIEPIKWQYGNSLLASDWILAFNDLDTGEKTCFLQIRACNYAGKYYTSYISYEDIAQLLDAAKKLENLHLQYPQHGDFMISSFKSNDGHVITLTMEKGKNKWSMNVGGTDFNLHNKFDLVNYLYNIKNKMEEIQKDTATTGISFNK